VGAAVLALAAPFTHILGPSTTFGKDLMARIAGLLEAAQVSDIMAIESPPASAGRSTRETRFSTVESSGAGKVVGTVRTASFEAAADGAPRRSRRRR